MALHLVNIGFGSMVSAERLLAVVSPESAPIKRLVQEGKERGTAIDATFGRKTKSVLIMDTDHIILSALTPDVVSARMNGREPDPKEENSNE